MRMIDDDRTLSVVGIRRDIFSKEDNGRTYRIKQERRGTVCKNVGRGIPNPIYISI